MISRRVVLLALPALAACGRAPAGPARIVDWKGATYCVVTLDLRRVTLALVGQADRSLRTLEAAAASPGGRRLLMATNAGIFRTGEVPNGLFVEDGVERHALATEAGDGNFYLLPNGVFAVDAGGARVVETSRWTPGTGLRLATQSGPLLLAGGQVHPRFDPASASQLRRSGVGVSDARTVHFAISAGGVRFHDFATLFRDALGCPDALYLDGTISGMIGPEVPREFGADGRFAGVLVATDAGS